MVHAAMRQQPTVFPRAFDARRWLWDMRPDGFVDGERMRMADIASMGCDRVAENASESLVAVKAMRFSQRPSWRASCRGECSHRSAILLG